MSLVRLPHLAAFGLVWGCTGEEPSSQGSPVVPYGTLGSPNNGTTNNGTTNNGTTNNGTTNGSCGYPAGAVEPMAFGEVLSPYRWPDAIHRDGRRADLDLAQVPCAEDPDIDWSPHDVLVFVSIPAW